MTNKKHSGQYYVSGLSRTALVCALAGAFVFSGTIPSAQARADMAPLAGALKPGAPVSFADLIEHVSPAVVSINVETHEDGPASALPGGDRYNELPKEFRDWFRRQFPGQPNPQRPREGRALGSGFLISKNGHVVTNNHVVEHASKITVVMQDGREFKAKLIGRDPQTDLAVLKIKDDKALPYVEFAENIKLRVGDWVVAVGNPFGLGGTATAGIVSATGREIGSNAYDFIQIDASINRGNSGGPTFDLSGNVVGVNSQILSPTGGNIGIGFAIPAHIAAKITKELIKNGAITRGWLGVQIQGIDRDLADSAGLKDTKGALVASVVDKSPASKAGFKVGDLILKLDNETVEDQRDLTRQVGELFVNHKAKFLVLRDGKRKTITVTIGKRPADLGAPSTPMAKPESDMDEFGMTLAPLSEDDVNRLKLHGNHGILIESIAPDSPAYKKGFRAGAAILSAGSQTVDTPADFEAAVKAARKAGRKALRILVQTGSGQLFTALRLDDKDAE